MLIAGRKCAGILGEVAGGALVIGAGINVSLGAGRVAPGGRDLAAGWPHRGNDTAGVVLDRNALLAAILDSFGDLLDRWVAARGDVDASGLRAEYRRACATIGSRVRLELPGGAGVLAEAVDVALDGSLVVVDDAGRRAAYSAADVVHLRPGS